MNIHADKTQENKNQAIANAVSQKQVGSESTFQFVDNRPEAVAPRKLQELANNSPQTKQAVQLQAMADNYSARQQQSIQKKENNTGLPDNLKTGMENLSGMSLDDVKVHRNSDKSTQLQAHAYAQGSDIHIAPGQEKHLPHEAWHVVQQKQGRVEPTMQMKGKVNVNDDAGLEKEADVMGAKALQMNTNLTQLQPVVQLQNKIHGDTQVTQLWTRWYEKTDEDSYEPRIIGLPSTTGWRKLDELHNDKEVWVDVTKLYDAEKLSFRQWCQVHSAALSLIGFIVVAGSLLLYALYRRNGGQGAIDGASQAEAQTPQAEFQTPQAEVQTPQVEVQTPQVKDDSWTPSREQIKDIAKYTGKSIDAVGEIVTKSKNRRGVLLGYGLKVIGGVIERVGDKF